MAKKKAGKGKGKGKGKGGGKKKGKGGGGGGGENAITELEREIFTTKVQDLESKLDRQLTLSNTLEEENKVYQTRYEQEVEDKEDIVDYLKRSLQEHAVEISELQERLIGLKRAHQVEKENYERKLTKLQAEYDAMEEDLTGQNKTLAGKLAMLEEFRLQKDGLIAKVNEAEQTILDQRKAFKENRHEIEMKYIRDNDKLKKEMIIRIEDMAAEFRIASDKQLSYTMKQAIYETVRVNLQLKKTSDMALHLTESNIQLKKQEAEMKQQLSIREGVEQQLSTKAEGQKEIISLLQNKCQEQRKMVLSMDDLQKEQKLLQYVIEKLKNELSGAGNRIDSLEVEKNLLVKQMNATQEELKEQEDTNAQLISVIKTAEEVIKKEVMVFLMENEDEPLRRDKLLQQLLLLLDTAANLENDNYLPVDEEEDSDFLHKSDSCEFLSYETGSLGLIPGKWASPGRFKIRKKARNVSVQTGEDDVYSVSDEEPPRVFNATAAKILSETGLLSKFEKHTQEI